MNLVELATELEYVPKDQLAQLSQDPSNRYPQYLVLSEIQRRTANEKAYAAARPQPTTTVAEEVVGEFMQPKGLQAGMPSESAPTDVFSSEPMGIPASASMQQPMQPPMAMASGGLTGYQTGNRTAIEQSLQNPYLSNLLMNNLALSTVVDAQTAMQGVKESGVTPMQVGGGLLALAGAIPYVKRLKMIGQGAKNIYDKSVKPFVKKRYGSQPGPSQTVPTGVGAPFTVGSKTYNPGQVTIPGPRIGALRNTLLGTPEGRFLSAAVPITAGTYLMSGYDPETEENQEQRELTQAEKDYQKLMQDIQTANLKASQEDTKKGLGGAFSSTDLIQLGGTIMGAKNISELGQGLAAVAGASADRKTAAERAGLEARYLQAQTGKLEEETRLLPERQLTSQIDAVVKAIKQAEESGTDDARLQELRTYLQYLIASQAQTQGYNPQAMSGTNQSLIASYT